MALGYTSRQVGREAEGLSPRLIVVTEPGPRFITATRVHINLDPGLRRDDVAVSDRCNTPALALGRPGGLFGPPPTSASSRVGRSADSPRAIPARFARGAPRCGLAPLLPHPSLGRGERLDERRTRKEP